MFTFSYIVWPARILLFLFDLTNVSNGFMVFNWVAVLFGILAYVLLPLPNAYLMGILLMTTLANWVCLVDWSLSELVIAIVSIVTPLSFGYTLLPLFGYLTQ